MPGRIAVLVSGAGSNMVALAEACEAGTVPGKVVMVAADRDCAGLAAARDRGVTTGLVDFAAYRSRDEWNEAFRDAVAGSTPDLVVSAGFMRILSPSFVDAFAGRLINLHPSLLPAFPGAHAVRDALAHGVKVTGTTVHLVDYEVDHGPILLQEVVEVRPDDTEQSLHERIKTVEHELLPKACRLILGGEIKLGRSRTPVEPGH